MYACCAPALDVLVYLWYASTETAEDGAGIDMRMRKRHNLEPRMERCAEYLVSEPDRKKGKWKHGNELLLLEIGCGKGSFTCTLAKEHPDADIVAVEKVPDAMILAMERAKREDCANIRFIEGDAARLHEFFDRGEVNRIFINFCDPWPKSRDAKFRLTAPSFLRIYAEVLSDDGTVFLKTDNLPLFRWSLEQFRKENWQIEEETENLHENGIRGILTDYERRFMEQGITIKSLTARRTPHTLDMRAGVPPRLRDSALEDAYCMQKREGAE